MKTMSSLSKLTDDELLESTRTLVSKERELTITIIEHLQEIYDREAYASMGYSSIGQYCQEVLHYTEGETTTRINALKMVARNPHLKEKIREGKLGLTQISYLGASHHRLKKQGLPLNQRDEERLIKKCEGLSTRETNDIIKSMENERIKLANKMKFHGNTLALLSSPTNSNNKTEIASPDFSNTVHSIKVSDKTYVQMKMLRSLLGNHSDEELIMLLVKEKLKALEKHKKNSETQDGPDGNDATSLHPLKPRPQQEKSRTIPQRYRQLAMKRAGYRCQYVCNKTRKRCNEVHYLQIDHIKPFALGGNHAMDNLQVLCWRHNRMRAIKTFGLKTIKKFGNKPFQSAPINEQRKAS